MRVTRKERVAAAIRRREPDLIPVGEWIIDYEPASLLLGRPTLARGKATLAQALWEGRRDEVVESTKRDAVELVRRLDLDMVCVDLTYPRAVRYQPFEQFDHDTWQDKRGNVLRYSELTHDFMLLARGEAGWEPERPSQWVDGEFRPDPSELEVIEHVLSELGETHFTFTGMGSPHLPVRDWQGVEREMLRLAEDPGGMAAVWLESYQEHAKRIPFFAKLGFDAIIVGDDYGYNSGPFMSPRMFRQVYFPALQYICQAAHEQGLFLICHSCGNLRLILPQMIEAGIDVYQAIQPIEDIASLKRDFGKELCLWGGVSNHDLVVESADAIGRQVKEAISACAPGGGFILGSSHSITVGTPLENILAYLEAAGRHPQPAVAQ